MATTEGNTTRKSAAEDSAVAISQTAPLVIDMGKVKRSEAKKIAKGKGAILDHVEQALQYTKENLGTVPDDRVLVPVVIIYEKKQKKRRARPFGFM